MLAYMPPTDSSIFGDERAEVARTAKEYGIL
jgi:hypothetical protein